ncbi:MAG TPA: hypothetical protein VG123_17280 [Streptosporangiaceae bacterium]|nr:hypothetical protein [Streptosporangiaceae bacterium]
MAATKPSETRRDELARTSHVVIGGWAPGGGRSPARSGFAPGAAAGSACL